jgi:ribosomal protein L11 methyltransferase
LHGFEGECFISGILEEEREVYLREAADRGWEYVNEINDEGWLAFYFLSR